MNKREFLKSGHIPEKLKSAVINQLGGWKEFKISAPDIARHGIASGFGGFIYYSETHRFAMRNRDAIIELLEETASQLGQDVTSMVASFGVFRHSPMDSDEKKDLYKYLGGGRPEPGTITNAMAWFAAEEVSREYLDSL